MLLAFVSLILIAPAQTQPMKFLGISMNCTMNTFVNKLKGKGFELETNHNVPNTSFMRGTFAGERVKISETKARSIKTFFIGIYFMRAKIQKVNFNWIS